MRTSHLDHDTALQIANLINSIEVAHMMQQDTKVGSKDWKLWQHRLVQDTVELADRFGIKLPALETYRKVLERMLV